MKTSEENPADWFLLAADRLKVADLAYATHGITYSGVELLQEAVERYLKGYLVAKGWRLVKTHDLPTLVRAAIEFDQAFTAFSGLAADLTESFWSQHYPGGDMEGFGSDYDELRRQAGDLIQLILVAIRSRPNSEAEHAK